MSEPIRVLIVDDHELVRQGFVALLTVKPNVEVVGEAADGAEAVELARSLQPDVILLDNPTSGLDPLSTVKVEMSLQELKVDYSIVLVPHSVQQAARVADVAAFLLDGELVEVGPGEQLFTRPGQRRTEDYVTGRFG